MAIRSFSNDLSDLTAHVLRRDERIMLCRGTRLASPQKVLVLVPAAEYPAAAMLRALENELALAPLLDCPWAVRPLMLSRWMGRSALVLEDTGGTPLDQLIRQPLELAPFLRIALGIARALVEMHRSSIIHKDLRPANVIVDADGHVRLTGFGVATTLVRERQAPEPPEVIAGTLPYMAPEQTGRMNRSIDARSDLYACGVTFFEMLTGALPFSATDPMGWVHCHVARPPASLKERAPGISEMVSALVAKLLSKRPEDRYQTAAGLHFDLLRCLEECDSAEPGSFVLGTRDVSDKLLVSEQLYGREDEVATLLSAFNRVLSSGKSELVLVSGYSGIGKSSVVNEIHKVLVPPRALFAAGKFDQYKREIPYATLAQASQTLVRQVLAKSEDEVEYWRSALQAAVEQNGQLMVDLVPELEIVIGRQPPVVELAPIEAQARFQTTFRRFLAVFARPDHPLALFLDDLQWLDAATLVLLEHLATSDDARHLLIIGAYRDNEVDSLHPLARTLDAIRTSGARISEVVLAPLRKLDLAKLLSDALCTDTERVEELSELVHERSRGNPFFAIQFLSSLADERLLELDDAGLRWEWDVQRIRGSGFSDDVVELLLRKLGRLPAETREALKQFACLGNVARTRSLAISFGGEPALTEALWHAVRAGLVLRLEQSYAFLHDRVQEAAYALLPESERAAEHLRIGRALLAHVSAAELEDESFELVNQLDRALPLIVDFDERQRVAKLNLIAGRRARTSTAYASARTHFAAGSALLAEDGFRLCRDLAWELEHDLSASEFITGDLVAAEARLAALADKSMNVREMAAVTWLRITVYTAMDRSPRAVETGLAYLEQIGIVWSPQPSEQEMQSEYQLLLGRVGDRKLDELVDLPLMEDPDRRATVEVLMALVPPAVYTNRNFLLLVLFRMANISIEHGNTDASSVGYAYLGMYLGPTFNRFERGYDFAKLGFDLVEKRGLSRSKARVYMTLGYHVSPWTKPFDPGTFALLRRTFEAANEAGDVNYVAYCWYCLGATRLARGTPLFEVQREIETGLAFVTKTNFGLLIDILSLQLAFVRMLQGKTAAFGRFDSSSFDEARYETHVTENRSLINALMMYRIRSVQARFLAGNYRGALEAAALAEPDIQTMFGHLELIEFYFYAALAHAAMTDLVPGDELAQHVDSVKAYGQQLDVWASTGPENWANRAALVAAELARIERRDWEAQCLYESAIRSSREQGLVHNQALAFERAARFYASRGFETTAHAYLQNARSCYAQWGAEGKVRQLSDTRSEFRSEAGSSPSSAVGQLDLTTVLRVSQILMGEIELDKLIQTLLALAVENAGAERALLLLKRDDELRIEAEANTSASSVDVQLRPAPATFPAIPESIVRYVARTRRSLVLDDASVHTLFSTDPYVRQMRSRSVLCLPLVKQGNLVGALYLENRLTPHAFSERRTAVLEIIALQAALSLENALLFRELQRSEAYLSEAQKLSLTGSFGWDVATGEIFWSNETYSLMGYVRDVNLTLEMVLRSVHPDDVLSLRGALDTASRSRESLDHEHRVVLADGTEKFVHVLARPVVNDRGSLEYVGAIMDVTERKRAEEQLRLSAALRFEERVNERTRIARELHDTLMQSFQGLMLRFQTVDDLLPESPLAAKQALVGALERADMAIAEGRDAVQGLRDSTMLSADLPGALNALARELVRNQPPPESAEFRSHVLGTPRNLLPAIWEEVFRIAREALHNAFAHAKARQVEMEITYAEEGFGIRVADDGIGIDTSVLRDGGRPGHWGLLGMQERARRIGAKLEFRRLARAGTEVGLWLVASAAYDAVTLLAI